MENVTCTCVKTVDFYVTDVLKHTIQGSVLECFFFQEGDLFFYHRFLATEDNILHRLFGDDFWDILS